MSLTIKKFIVYELISDKSIFGFGNSVKNRANI